MAGVVAVAAFYVAYRGGDADDIWLTWSLVAGGVCAVFMLLTWGIALSGEKGESSDW